MQTVCIQPRSGTNSAASMQNNMPVWGGESSTSPETVPIKKRPRAGRKGSLTSELVRVSPRFALYKSGRHHLYLHTATACTSTAAPSSGDGKRGMALIGLHASNIQPAHEQFSLKGSLRMGCLCIACMLDRNSWLSKSRTSSGGLSLSAVCASRARSGCVYTSLFLILLQEATAL
eukprot:1161383-Pelagomonas_calceolata.AAC.4